MARAMPIDRKMCHTLGRRSSNLMETVLFLRTNLVVEGGEIRTRNSMFHFALKWILCPAFDE